MYYVYKIINKTNNKIYVGQTNDLKSRWLKHCSCARDASYNHPLYNSIRKYGVDNFTYEVIEQFDNLNDCNKSEEFWIQQLKTQDRNIGYNIAYGGDNRAVSQETRDKLSKIISGECNPFYGKNHSEKIKQKLTELRIGTTASDKTKQKMSEVKSGENNPMFGKQHSEKTIDKMSQIKIGKYDGENNPFYGQTHSQETRDKLSELNTGKILSDKTKEKISESLKGKMSGENNPMYGKIGADNPMFGKSHSDETREKIAKSKKGKKRKPFTEETRRKMSEARRGRKYPRTT